MIFINKELEKEIEKLNWKIYISNDNEDEFFVVDQYGKHNMEDIKSIFEDIFYSNNFIDVFKICTLPFKIIKKYKDKEHLSQEMFENHLEGLLEKNIKLQEVNKIYEKIDLLVSKQDIELVINIEQLDFIDKKNR